MNDPALPSAQSPTPAAPPQVPRHTVFFISDGTGITAETFGNSILSQFAIKPRHLRRPFIDTPDKAHQVVREINHTAEHDGRKPIVFITLVNTEILSIVKEHARGLVLDMFNTFIEPLEAEFGITSNHRIGRFSDVSDSQEYTDRIEAINFALAHDDGQSAKNLAEADVILVGVSRSGKTPTSLYLAMQHGIKAANYPLIPEDFERGKLPSTLMPFKAKCFGLTIDPDRLARIRNERRPNSKYASIENCRYEVREGEAMMKQRRHRLAVVDAQVDRGDRDDDPARPQAGPAGVLTRRLAAQDDADPIAAVLARIADRARPCSTTRARPSCPTGRSATAAAGSTGDRAAWSSGSNGGAPSSYEQLERRCIGAQGRCAPARRCRRHGHARRCW